MSTNIYFFNENCKWCYKLMLIMNNAKLLQNFKLIKINNNPNIPSLITATPALVISGYPKVLFTNECFKWVSSYMQIKKDQNNIQMMNQKNIYIMSELMKNNGDNNLNNAEQNSFSDLFSFVQNNNVPQNHNFISPKQQLNYIFTAPELKKINQKEQQVQVNNEINKRKQQDDYYKNYMKQFH